MAVSGDVTLSANATGNSTGSVNVTLSLTSGWENLVAYTYTPIDDEGHDVEVKYRLGTCYVDGNCFGTVSDSGEYYPGERCSFTIDRAATFTVRRFDTNAGFMGIGYSWIGEPDVLFGSNRYFGNFGKASGPSNEEVSAGEVITWGSSGNTRPLQVEVLSSAPRPV